MKCYFGVCKELVGGWQTFCWLGEKGKKNTCSGFSLLLAHAHGRMCTLMPGSKKQRN